MFDVLRDYGTILILREHTLPRFVLIRHVRFRTRMPIRARPRYENRMFDLIDVPKKVYAPFKHDAHGARSFVRSSADCAFTFAAFFASMTHRKEQTHYHANSRTIAIQNFKLLYWFVHKHGCAHTASKP